MSAGVPEVESIEAASARRLLYTTGRLSRRERFAGQP